MAQTDTKPLSARCPYLKAVFDKALAWAKNPTPTRTGNRHGMVFLPQLVPVCLDCGSENIGVLEDHEPTVSLDGPPPKQYIETSTNVKVSN